MSTSFERLVDGVIEALETHVLPGTDDFARGQIFSVIFALNGLKLTADWKTGPLLEQVRLQDTAFTAVRRLADKISLADKINCPPLPATPRLAGGIVDAATVETLRDEGDRVLGRLLLWVTGPEVRATNRVAAAEIEAVLRRLICAAQGRACDDAQIDAAANHRRRKHGRHGPRRDRIIRIRMRGCRYRSGDAQAAAAPAATSLPWLP